MYVPRILSDSAVSTWFKSMWTLFGCLKKQTKLGQPAKPKTARQQWTLVNFQFISAHLSIWMDTSQLSRVSAPRLQLDLEEEEEGGDDDDAASRNSSQAPSTQLPNMAQASPSQAPCDRRPRPASNGSGTCADEAILKLADCLSQNTGVQYRLATAVQESPKPCLAFCQWIGVEMSKLDEEQWTGFMHKVFNLVECYRTFQAQQPAPPHPPPAPQAAQQPPVQPPQQPFFRP